MNQSSVFEQMMGLAWINAQSFLLPELPSAQRQEIQDIAALKSGWCDNDGTDIAVNEEALWYAEWSVRCLMEIMDAVPKFRYSMGFFGEIDLIFNDPGPRRVNVIFTEGEMTVHRASRGFTAEEHLYADPKFPDYGNSASLSRLAQVLANALRS